MSDVDSLDMFCTSAKTLRIAANISVSSSSCVLEVCKPARCIPPPTVLVGARAPNEVTYVKADQRGRWEGEAIVARHGPTQSALGLKLGSNATIVFFRLCCEK